VRIEDATPGLPVVYRPHPDAPAEDGTVVRVSPGGMVFVLYRGDTTAKATRPADLEEAR
jgi:hypothetical protein